MLSTLRRWLRRASSPGTTRRGRRPSWKPELECLEARETPAVVNYHGGNVLTHVKVTSIFYGSQWQTDSNLQQLRSQIDGFFQNITQSSFMDLLGEYYEEMPFTGADIPVGRGSYQGELVDNVAAGNLTDSNIQGMLDAARRSGSITPDSWETLYFVFTPPGFTDQSPNRVWNNDPDPNKAWGGLHSSFYDAYYTDSQGLTHGNQINYAVIPFPVGVSETNALNPITLISSHELAEAVTDPDAIDSSAAPNMSGVGDGWTTGTVAGSGAEIGDLAEKSNLKYGSLPLQGVSYIIQAVWSNNAYAQTGDGRALPAGATLLYETGSGNGSTSDGTGNDSGMTLPTLDASPASVPPLQPGATFSGTLATFSEDPAPTSTGTFTASINWGDGSTSTGTVTTASPNVSNVAGSHSYAGAGTYTVQIQITGSDATSANVSTPVTVYTPAPSALAVSAGSGQSTPVATAFNAPLQVQVTDQYTHPLGGVAVTFTAPASGAGGTFASTGSGTVTVQTNGSGLATAPTFTADTTAGTYSVTASVAGLSPVAFSLTNSPGAPAHIGTTSGTPQQAQVGAVYPQAFVATVTDAYGNPVSGDTVTFAAPLTGPSGLFTWKESIIVLTGAAALPGSPPGSPITVTRTSPTLQVTTNAAGQASSANSLLRAWFAANQTVGNFTLTATAAGLSTPADFQLTNTTNLPAAAVAVQAGSGQSAAVGGTFAAPLQALVTDSLGRPVSGVTVTFSAPASGATGSFNGSASATVQTDGSGVATAPAFTAGTQAGSYTVTATAAGVTTPAAFSLANTAGTATRLAVAGGNGQSATVNTAFAAPLQAQVTDRYGNPVAGVGVTFAAPGSGPGGAFGGTATATVSTNSSGLAVAPPLTANGLAGGYAVTVTAAGVGGAVEIALTNTPAPVYVPPPPAPAAAPTAPQPVAVMLVTKTLGKKTKKLFLRILFGDGSQRDVLSPWQASQYSGISAALQADGSVLLRARQGGKNVARVVVV
jgi:hypothetical protein